MQKRAVWNRTKLGYWKAMRPVEVEFSGSAIGHYFATKKSQAHAPRQKSINSRLTGTGLEQCKKDHAESCGSWRSLAMSRVGAFPKKRLYSLLNCDALRYPTRWLAVPASIIADNMSRLASCSLSTF